MLYVQGWGFSIQAVKKGRPCSVGRPHRTLIGQCCRLQPSRRRCHCRLRPPGLERLCRYTARPSIATERLSSRSDGRLTYRFKRPWSNGTTHIVLEPLELVEKFAALVPPPRFHLVRYHGVLAPVAKWRSEIVPEVPHDDAGLSDCSHPPATEQSVPRPLGRHNYSWSQLMRRVFAIDVLDVPVAATASAFSPRFNPPTPSQDPGLSRSAFPRSSHICLRS